MTEETARNIEAISKLGTPALLIGLMALMLWLDDRENKEYLERVRVQNVLTEKRNELMVRRNELMNTQTQLLNAVLDAQKADTEVSRQLMNYFQTYLQRQDK